MNQSLILISNENCLLGTSVFELLSKDSEVREVRLVASVDEALVEQRKDKWSLVIYFLSQPSSSLHAKLEKLVIVSGKIMIVVCAYNNLTLSNLMRLNADALISADMSFQELRLAIRTVIQRSLKYLSPVLISAMASQYQETQRFSKLSQKELDVAMLILEGQRNAEIAVKLNISHKTVSTYKTRIYKKLGISNELQLYIYAGQTNDFQLPRID